MLTERTTTLFVSIFYFQKCQTRDYTIDSKKIKHVAKIYSIFTYSFQNNDMSLIY